MSYSSKMKDNSQEYQKEMNKVLDPSNYSQNQDQSNQNMCQMKYDSKEYSESSKKNDEEKGDQSKYSMNMNNYENVNNRNKGNEQYVSGQKMSCCEGKKQMMDDMKYTPDDYMKYDNSMDLTKGVYEKVA